MSSQKATIQGFTRVVISPFRKIILKSQELKRRRPHRSFKKTDTTTARRDLKLPSYWLFTKSVWKIIWNNKRFYLKFFLLFCVFSVALLGILNQDTYINFRDQLNKAEDNGTANFGLLKYATLAISAVTSSSGASISDGQKVVGILMFIVGWLMLVWALRMILAGYRIRLRDALYSAGAPLMSTLAVFCVAILQLIPLAVCFIVYNALTNVGIINSGIAIENMAFWFVIVLTAVLTLYWWTSTFVALIITTTPPCMYPGEALRLAGDIVVGRRLKILLRLLYMLWPILIIWILVLIPATILDNTLQVNWLPLIPLTVLLLTSLTIIWIATYIYLLYRRIVDSDNKLAL